MASTMASEASALADLASRRRLLGPGGRFSRQSAARGSGRGACAGTELPAREGKPRARRILRGKESSAREGFAPFRSRHR